MGARAASWFLVVGLLVATSATGCGSRGTPIQSPVGVTAGQTFAQTEHAIRDVLARRHWFVESHQPGRIVAYLTVRKHRLRVDIRYDPQQVNVYYLDSENLRAELGPDGQVYAHPKVNVWLRNLATEISQALAVATTPATSGGALPGLVPEDPSMPADPSAAATGSSPAPAASAYGQAAPAP